MKVNAAELGQVVISKQGHDCGTWYVVVKVLPNSVLVSDGVLHPFSRPKRKNVKHVEIVPFTVDLEQTGESGGRYTDADLRKQLKSIQKEQILQIGHAANMLGTNQHKEDCALVQK